MTVRGDGRARRVRDPGAALLTGCAWLLAAFVGGVLRVRRAHVERALARAGMGAPARTAAQMYRSLATGLFELLAMAAGWLEPRRLVSGMGSAGVLEPPASSTDAAGVWPRGPAIVATAHTANWDLVACAVAERTPLTVVTKRLSISFLDRLWQRARARRGVRLIEAGSAVTGIRGALSRGELVAMLVDQAPERARAVIEVSFLGSPAWVDLSPALCALRARVPLVAAFPLRREDGTYTIEIARTLIPPSSARAGRASATGAPRSQGSSRSGRDWAENAMREVTAALEAFVRRHPEQWLWMHRRWKPLPEPSAVRRAPSAGEWGPLPAPRHGGIRSS